MRIARLASENPRTQGPERRAWYRRHSPEHLRMVAGLVEQAVAARTGGAEPRAVVLGAGACTELPLEWLARRSGSVLLVDIDVPGMLRARDALPDALRARVNVVAADLTGGVSVALAAELRVQPWADLARLGDNAPLDAAAACLARCQVLDPPPIPELQPAGYDLVISSLTLTQLFSLPLLDVLDVLCVHAPAAVDLRETHTRYRAAAEGFRRRVALAHLSLLGALLAPGAAGVLVSDVTGHLLPPVAGAHAAAPVDSLPVLPPEVLDLSADVAARFTPLGTPRTWRWLVSRAEGQQPGRAYDVAGVVLRGAD
ncbi:MAG TPA: hypothetical protein VE258_01490 [Ktedonobacterales bacterium]|nr:hypothetical protein [Ktedonobacterales bacterium]